MNTISWPPVAEAVPETRPVPAEAQDSHGGNTTRGLTRPTAVFDDTGELLPDGSSIPIHNDMFEPAAA